MQTFIFIPFKCHLVRFWLIILALTQNITFLSSFVSLEKSDKLPPYLLHLTLLALACVLSSLWVGIPPRASDFPPTTPGSLLATLAHVHLRTKGDRRVNIS